MPHSSIVAWLNDIGLEQLRTLFAEQQIALEDLPDLSEQDLEKLAIPLGPRKRLMKAIAALSSSTVPTQPDKATEPVSARTGTRSHAAATRAGGPAAKGRANPCRRLCRACRAGNAG